MLLLVPEAGIEPTTISLEGCRSIQLSYPGMPPEVLNDIALRNAVPSYPFQYLGAYRLSHSYNCSTIGATRLNFRVRDGNGCTPRAISTEILETIRSVREKYDEKTPASECLDSARKEVRRRGRKAFLDTFRAISIARLKTLLSVHLQPINPVVSRGTYRLATEESHLWVGFPLRCFQRLSIPNLATRLCRWSDNRYTRGSFNPVLSY